MDTLEDTQPVKRVWAGTRGGGNGRERIFSLIPFSTFGPQNLLPILKKHEIKNNKARITIAAIIY